MAGGAGTFGSCSMLFDRTSSSRSIQLAFAGDCEQSHGSKWVEQRTLQKGGHVEAYQGSSLDTRWHTACSWDWRLRWLIFIANDDAFNLGG